MARRRSLLTGLFILLGALTGAVAGMSGRPAMRSPDRASARTASEGARRLALPSIASTTIGAPTLKVEPSATLAVGAALAPSSIPPSTPRPTIDLTPPASKDELFRAEIRCVREIPEDCERTARALELGQILPREARRAQKLTRFALSLYVKQCERSRALACARLAEMHETGETVYKNPATAKALWARFQELCARKPNQAGCALPSPG